MHSLEDMWEEVVRSLDYRSEAEMYANLYTEKGMSINSLAGFFGVSPNTLKKRMKAKKVQIRRPGGPNRLGMSRVTKLTDAQMVNVKQTAEEMNLHVSAVFKEKRRRREVVDRLRLDPPRGTTGKVRRRGLSMRGDHQLMPGKGLRVVVRGVGSDALSGDQESCLSKSKDG